MSGALQFDLEPRATPPWAAEARLARKIAWSEAQAVRYVRRLAAEHYENFPVFTVLFAPEVIESLCAVYAFARIADDFADEPAFTGLRLEYLDAWEEQLEQCFDGRARHPVFVALNRARLRHNLGLEPFRDLLSAFRQDCVKQEYRNFDEVLDYCRRSADPVGRIVLRLLDLDSPERIALSDRLCTALQLTNFWQDLSVDLPRGRVYLPQRDLATYGLSVEELGSAEPPPSAARLLRLQGRRTRALFRGSARLPRIVPYPASVYLSAVWRGGRTMLEMVERSGVAVLSRRPALSRAAAAHVFLRAVIDAFRPERGSEWMPPVSAERC